MTSEMQVYKLYHDLKNVNTDGERVAIVLARADAIRRECADRAIHYIDNNVEAYQYRVEEFRAAILGTEPAREES